MDVTDFKELNEKSDRLLFEQFKLLSEKSKNTDDCKTLCELTSAMATIYNAMFS